MAPSSTEQTRPMPTDEELEAALLVDDVVEEENEFVDILQGVVDKHRKRSRSRFVRRKARSRKSKRGF